jgi:Mn2+/Fe2+ NRAMP family transporter
MGSHANSRLGRAMLWAVGLAVAALNVLLLWNIATGSG